MVPVPRDLPLPLPVPEGFLLFLIVPSFLLHLLFVNLTVGGALYSVIFEITGLRFPRFDRLARLVSETITVNKSMAVVLGIAPLLVISLLYTPQFYAANTLTGHAWAMLVPLVSGAFLLAYLHKYTWDRWQGRRKRRHLLTGVAMVLCFLFIPLIFLSNINLMLFPEKWSEVSGFFASLRVGNVFPRYLHFLAASLALTGLFLAAWFGRRNSGVEERAPEFERRELMRYFYRWTFFVSCAQFVIGPLTILTLPTRGLGASVLVAILGGAAMAILTLLMLWEEIQRPRLTMGWRYWVITSFFALTALEMGYGRHRYREETLAEHKRLVQERTLDFQGIESGTQMLIAAGLGSGESRTGPPSGRTVFLQVCGSCHSRTRPVYAPALTEIYELHKDHPEDIVKWAKNPGKKRPQFQQMPSMDHLGDEALEAVAKYMLEQGAPVVQKASASKN
ncbi:MAG: cytochrome c [Bryobacteraceae bacterium]